MKMAVFRREMTALGQLFPHPAEDSVTAETPPVFTFLGDPEISDYTVRVYDDEGDLAWEGRTATMAIVPDKILPPGRYTWDVIANAGTTAAVHRGIFLLCGRAIRGSLPYCAGMLRLPMRMDCPLRHGSTEIRTRLPIGNISADTAITVTGIWSPVRLRITYWTIRVPDSLRKSSF